MGKGRPGREDEAGGGDPAPEGAAVFLERTSEGRDAAGVSALPLGAFPASEAPRWERILRSTKK